MTFPHCLQVGHHSIVRRLLLHSTLLCCGLFVGVSSIDAQAPSNGKLRLSKIEFIGLERHSAEAAIAASGLQIGQLIDVSALDVAAQRLMDSGLFKKLSYRYRTKGEQAVVTFHTEEEQGAEAPVVFDNFVWFNEEELFSAIRQQVPSFAGAANDSAVSGVTKALEQLLQSRKLAGRVEYSPSADLARGTVEHIFSVSGLNVAICKVNFSGATAVPESDLVSKSKSLIGDDYRRTFVFSFAKANLTPIYRERGHLRADFGAPTAKLEPESTSDCKDGVSVTVPVEEGPIYSWGKAEWAGNTALSNPELAAALGMKPDELANGLKIDKGIESVRVAYGTKGHLDASLKATPVFEAGSRSVTYGIEVNEGPQYRMGLLKIVGLSEGTTNRLLARWKLKSRDVYDAGYLKEFLTKEMVLDETEIGASPKKVESEIKVDRAKFTVDVTISVK
jgi:outer membrane protein assembly factor BamA